MSLLNAFVAEAYRCDSQNRSANSPDFALLNNELDPNKNFA